MGNLLPKITGQVIGHYNAYKGSRAAYNSDKILIVRGMSADNIAIEEMETKLAELEEILGSEEISINSDAGKNFIEKIDTQLRESMEIESAPDTGGIAKMTNQLESMGLKVESKLFKMKHATAFVATWKDKSGFGPLYVEITVSDNDV
ncbi:MAG: DUF2120 domain-containing protein [archaeon]|nr:DUF2120 domain-containing protein [archaeon]